MPSKTGRQKRAMAAACAGKGTSGIPQDVGCEFKRADDRKAARSRRSKRRR